MEGVFRGVGGGGGREEVIWKIQWNMSFIVSFPVVS